jgi:UDP-2,4-diacetamido-2,4,6-trideoxy-beta-L-altropyranose hydrolase
LLNKQTVFESDRLYFRGIDTRDCDIILSWRNALPRNSFAATPVHLTSQRQLEWYHKYYLTDDNRIDFLIYEKNGDCPVGVVGVKGLDYNNHKGEVSYMIGEPAAGGKGYAVESVRALCALLIENGIVVIQALINKENSKSKAIVIKNDFSLVAELSDGYELYEKRAKKQLSFRVDGNEAIGTGHVMRCLSIADAASEMGVACSFITADAQMKPVIEGRGYPVYILDSVWSQLDSELDVLGRLILEKHISCLLVDSYFVTTDYMRALAKLTRLVYMDDLFKEKYDCAALINYNCYALDFGYEKVYTSPEPQLLLGLQYVPLRPEFVQLPPFLCRETVSDILITTGGTDSRNIAGMLSARLADELKRKVRLHVVVGGCNHNYPFLEELSQKEPCIVLHPNVTRMSELMCGCDLAVSAGGTTLYELCACGIPTIVFMMADNQEYPYEEFTKEIMLPGGNALVNVQDCISTIAMQVHSLLGAPAHRQMLSRRMQSLVDGKGSHAIANKLFSV